MELAKNVIKKLFKGAPFAKIWVQGTSSFEDESNNVKISKSSKWQIAHYKIQATILCETKG